MCHDLPQEKPVTRWKTFNEMRLEALCFKSENFPDTWWNVLQSVSFPKQKCIHSGFQKFCHKKNTLLVIYCILPCVEKRSLSASCFTSFLDKTELRRPKAYPLIYRKSPCNCLWKADPWQIQLRSWFCSEIYKVCSHWLLKTLGNEFLEQRKGTGARILGWERKKKTAELINSQRPETRCFTMLYINF